MSTTSSSRSLVPLTAIAGTVPRQPRVTSQMNATWMKDFRATSIPDPPSGSSTRLKASSAPCSAQELSLVRRFNLVYWDNSVDTASLQIVAECPDWPQWSLDKFSGLPFLGSDIKSVQLYSTTYRVWMTISMDCRHPLTTNCAILLRRSGVTGIDEQKHIDLFVSASPRRFRTNQFKECAAIRASLKERSAKGRPPPTSNYSDSDVEVVDTPPPPPQKRQRIEEVLATPLRQCPKLYISIAATPAFFDLSDSPSTSVSPPPFSSLLSLCTGDSTPSIGLPSPVAPRWPKNWYAVDILAGFNRIDTLSKLDTQRKVPVDLASHLSSVFGCNIPQSTYRDARSRWDKASQSLRNKVLEGGRTPSGLWTYLASRVPLKG